MSQEGFTDLRLNGGGGEVQVGDVDVPAVLAAPHADAGGGVGHLQRAVTAAEHGAGELQAALRALQAGP